MQPFFPDPEKTQTSGELELDIHPHHQLEPLDTDAVSGFDKWDDAGDVDHKGLQ